MKKIDPNLTLSEKRAIAGSRGGKRTVKRYGKRYMRRLAKWAAHCMHVTYQITPVGICQYALVNRRTGVIKAYLSGRQVEIAKERHHAINQQEISL